MKLYPVGELGYTVRLAGQDVGAHVRRLAWLLRQEPLPGQLEVAEGYSTVTVALESAPLNRGEWVRLLHMRAEQSLAGRVSGEGPAPGVLHEISVYYGGDVGPDLEAVAEMCGLTVEEVIRIHSHAQYEVAMLGFAPGFPYLKGLPEQLAVPRRETPRLAVPPGAVAIGGGQTGIYPFRMPGGWHLIGHTPVQLFDPNREPPVLLQPGDRVRFVPAAGPALQARAAAADSHSANVGGVTVVKPGLLLTVQDLGRVRGRAIGLPVGGAADPASLAIANILVGNDRGEAGLELTIGGAVLQADRELLVAVCGEEGGLRVNGVPMPMWSPLRLAPGDRIAVEPRGRGCRTYIAFGGGVLAPLQLGGRSSDSRFGIGWQAGRALQADDSLPVGEASPLGRELLRMVASRYSGAASWSVSRSLRLGEAMVRPVVLRMTAAPELGSFAADPLRRFFHTEYTVLPQSDRMGLRLTSDTPLIRSHAFEMVSEAVAPGTVQVPPDGKPIALHMDAQTTGGYPRLGYIARCDWPLLGQLRPGDRVRFRLATLREADRAWRLLERELNRLEAAVRMLVRRGGERQDG